MKKITIILLLAISAFAAKAQSPSMTIDSLQRYINRYIRNSAVEAFTNLRMNTVLTNLARYADSAIGAGTLDTTYRVGDSLKIVTNLKTFTVYIGGTGGNQNLSVTTTSTTVNVNIDGTGTDATLPAVTTSTAGVMTGAMKSKLDSAATHRLWKNDSIIIYYNSLGIEKWRDTLKALNALNSLDGAGNAIQLDNDQASPGNNMVYGTNNVGGKLWKADPVGGATTVLKSTDSFFYNNGSNVYFARDSVKQGITMVTPVTYTSVTKRADALSVIKLPSSARMWMFYSQFGSSSGDNDTSEIRGKYSDDNGRTWSAYQIVVPVSGTGVYIPSAYFNKTNDTLYVIYLRANTTITNQLYQTYSTNFTSNTPTWSTGVSIYGSGSEYYSPASDRVLKLKNGEYLYPFCLNINGILFSSTGTYKGRLLRRASGNNAWSLVSGVDIVSPDSLCVEGGLFQTDDENSLVTYFWRTRSDQVYFAQSTTSSGLVYGSALPSGLYAPNSTTTIAYLEKFRTLVAVHNKWRGAAGTFTQREQLQLSVKHLGRDNGVNIFNNGVEGQWHSIYTIDSLANKHFIEPTIFPSDNELMVFYSQGDSYTGDTFEIKRASFPYYFLQGSDESYQSSLMLNKTFDGVTSPNWLSIYANGLSRTANFLSLGNQTNSINYFAPWWRLTTTRNAGDMLLHTIDAPGTSGSFFNIDGQTSAAAVANTQKILGITNNGVLKFGVFGDGRIGLGGFAGDVSSPSNGQVWYNSTINKFRAYQNGAVVDVISAGGSGTDTSYIFTNGLTKTTVGTTNTVKLGGTLTANTLISQAGFDFGFSGGGVRVGGATLSDASFLFELEKTGGVTYASMRNIDNNTNHNELRIRKEKGSGNFALSATDLGFSIAVNTIARMDIVAGNDLAADNFRNFDLSFKSRLGSSSTHEIFRVRSYGAVEVAQWGGTGSAGPMLTLYQADRGIANAFIDFRNYATTGTGGFAPTLKTKSDGSGAQYGFEFNINANVNLAGDGFGMVYNIHNAGATITGTNPLYDIRNNAASVFRIRPDGEINIGNTTDQGAYTLQNTGGLYQSGAVTLKGIATAPSTYNVAVHSTTLDSGLYVIPVASLTIEGTYTPTLTSVANITGTPTVTTCYYSVSGTTVTVWGEITFDPTVTLTATEVGISLPPSYVSAIANSYELVGSATSDAINEAMNIKGDVTNDRARLLCTPTDVTNRTASFKITYHYIAP